MVVKAQRRSKGLSILWRSQDEVKIKSYFKNHIDCEVSFECTIVFRLTSIYGELIRSLRKNYWDMIMTLHGEGVGPWCLIVDYNNVLCQSKKWGRD